MNEQRLDWQEAYARLEKARQALEAGRERSPEDVARILKDRARALAKPAEEVQAPAEALDLLVFSLAGERYGVETAHVLEVLPLRDPTPVPCVPSFILGVVNHRGRIIAVLDLRRLIELAGQGATEGSHVVVVEAGGMTFGLFADAVSGTIRVGMRDVAPPPVALPGGGQALIKGVTGAMVSVLDLESLVMDRRIVVNEVNE
ncbi:MAG: purine-binding chemotaxis protein CheW [Nitrospirae bacterium]|nr:purine-binding chemotaxis protein CheW [Nitrospirota bacterium]